ncbi:MAG: hypothetical protein JWM95_1959 [Gemmatimonadetes bacterium]|nr:hypothetical protein [Gemmatimonadota bacterium]
MSTACLNCGSPLTGPFCASCGQRDIPPYPGVKDLVVDAFWELSGWDGRFANTVKALVQRPGMLTREFLEGRRARYISPLRLYLMASLVYFVLAAAAPSAHIMPDALIGRKPDASQPAAPLSTSGRLGKEAGDALANQRVLSPAERDRALKDMERAPSVLRPFLRKAVSDPVGFRRGIIATMPRMLFALLPMFAAIVGLFHRDRKYPEHLYFAIHLHAFIFLAFCIPQLLKLAHVPMVGVVSAFIAVLCVPTYATMAFRLVYGGSVTGTLVKEACIAAIYAVVSLVAFIIMIYWIAVTST